MYTISDVARFTYSLYIYYQIQDVEPLITLSKTQIFPKNLF